MDKNIVISISRKYGCGGRELAQILAKKLNVKLYDRKIVHIAAAKLETDDLNENDLLELEKPFLIKTNLDILTGYFVDTVKRKVSAESMISYEGRKYSVPPQYIGKKVDISDTGSGFDISFNNHFVRHWEKSDKMMNFNHSDYIEIARRSSLKRLDEDEIKLIAERNLEIYDKL